MRNTAPKDAAELEALETREWLESLDYVLQSGGPARVSRLLRELSDHARRHGVKQPFTANTPYINTIPAERAAAVPRQPRDRAPHQEPRALERAGDGGQGQQARRRHRRPHLDVRVRRDALRSRVQPLLPRQGRSQRRRHHLLPGPRGARHLRARVHRRPAAGGEARELPARAGGGRRPLVVSASVADAGLLGVPDGVDGARPDLLDLSGALHALPGGSRPEEPVERQGLGVPRRRRDRRAGVARRDHARLAREARQPDLRHQLQPAAARRPGPRQRPDHPGARSDLPRRRLERDQGDLGQRVGLRCSRRITTACSSSAWARSSTASIRSTRSSRATTSASISGARIRSCSRWWRTCRTSS